MGDMIEESNQELELNLIAAGRTIRYPPTPDLAGRIMKQIQAIPSPERQGDRQARRRLRTSLVYTLAVLLVLFAGLLAVPSVRAQILEFIQIGVVRIFTGTPAETPTLHPTLTSQAPSRPNPSLLEIDGLTTLDHAVQQAEFDIRLPEYPPDLGQPDRVYFQDLEGQMLVLVWLDPDDPEKIRLSLHEYYGEAELILTKGIVERIDETWIHDQRAVWVEGPYYLKLVNGELNLVRLIEGRVLIWEENEVTYRLETDLSLEEAVRIAESLQPIK
jgi:hypothetical protein